MSIPRIILDTNVLLAALKSKGGASYKLLTAIGRRRAEISVSVPLLFEYEAVAKRKAVSASISKADIDVIINALAARARECKVYYLWRPFLRDPKDDMILEAAVAGNCQHIVAFNLRDFVGVEKQFGIEVLTPSMFLKRFGDVS